MSPEEKWLQRHATHTCPHYGGRFSPERCDRRREVSLTHSNAGWGWAGKANQDGGLDFSKCRTCDGPVEIRKHKEGKVKPAVVLPKPKVAMKEPATTQPPETQTFKYSCELHGPHNGFQIGLSHCQKCPTCNEEARREAIRAKISQRIILDFGSASWLHAWITEQADASGISPETWIIRQMANLVPADDIKAAMLEGLGK